MATTAKRRKIVLIAVVALLVVGLLAGSLAAELGGPSPSSTASSAPASPAATKVLDRALAAARAAGSFHYSSSSMRVTSSAKESDTAVGDAGPTSGKQIWTTTDPSGTAIFTVVVVGSACYFNGNALAMTEQLGVSQSVAQAHTGQWISLSPTDAPYAVVYVSVIASEALVDNITLKAQQLGSTTLSGRTLQTVSGAITPVTIAGQVQVVKGTATLDVSSATHLPIRYHQRGKMGNANTSETVNFSRFGKTVSESVPPGAVSYSSIGGASGAPGGGPGSSTTPSILTTFPY